jgi:lysine 2,3-aminomutase
MRPKKSHNKTSITDYKSFREELLLRGIEINKIISFRDFEKIKKLYPFKVSYHFIKKIKSEKSPLLTQILPQKMELDSSYDSPDDPLGEKKFQKPGGIIHRYPDRVLWIITNKCASHCRFCGRKSIIGQKNIIKKNENSNSENTRPKALNYIKKNNKIKEVILSGGDPLTLSNSQLDIILSKLRSIGHIKIIRIHSRILTFLPKRINSDFMNLGKKYGPIYFVTHFNHKDEIGRGIAETCRRMRENQYILLNQSVILKGINDTVSAQRTLLYRLSEIGISPYYLHCPDRTAGNSHFWVPVRKIHKIVKSLQGWQSGVCIPRIMIELPGGEGKAEISPNQPPPENNRYCLESYRGDEFLID